MKHYLIRAKMNPLEDQSLNRIVVKDLIGTNIGNLLFPYSIMRTLSNEDVYFDTFGSSNECKAQEINEKYDAVIIPLANAFRDDFRGELKKLTSIIRELKIPCIVVGTGLQTKLEPDFSNKFPFDNDVLDFCSVVLEKSASIGVRGEITYRYLKRLGISDSCIDVIGCPSMYMWGEELPLKMPKGLNENSKISFNHNGNNANLFEFLERSKAEFTNYRIVLQEIAELRLLYAGATVHKKYKPSEYYANSTMAKDFINNKLISFVNVPSWLNYFSDIDCTVGTRIHGSIASILSGTPTLTITTDARVRELAEYHNIPHISINDINENTRLGDLYENTDFTSVRRGHKERYLNYIGFLNKNGLCVANYKDNFSRKCYFDKLEAKVKLVELKGISPYIHLEDTEKKREQLQNYVRFTEGKISWFKRQVEQYGLNTVNENGLKEWNDARQCVIKNLQDLNL